MDKKEWEELRKVPIMQVYHGEFEESAFRAQARELDSMDRVVNDIISQPRYTAFFASFRTTDDARDTATRLPFKAPASPTAGSPLVVWHVGTTGSMKQGTGIVLPNGVFGVILTVTVADKTENIMVLGGSLNEAQRSGVFDALQKTGKIGRVVLPPGTAHLEVKSRGWRLWR